MKVALILNENRPLSTYPSVFNTAHILSKKGWKVSLFVPENMNVDYELKNVKIIKFAITKQAIIGLLPTLFKYTRGYNLLISFHQYALIGAGLINLFYRIPFVYFCLEILAFDQIMSFKSKIRKRLEIFFNKRAVLTIVQDVVRKNMIFNLHKLNNETIFCVPNSYMGIVNQNGDYLRKKWGIPEDRIIVLYAGGIEQWAIDEKIIAAVKDWDDKFVFVLHGWSRDGYIEKLRPIINEINMEKTKIYLSEDTLSIHEYEQMVSSADIGLCWYRKNLPENVKKIGFSSGKFSSFLRSGLPVIVPTYLEGISNFIEKYQFGIEVPDEFEIKKALTTISSDYQKFRNNAFQFYKERIDFEINFEKVFNKLNDILRLDYFR